MWHQHGAGLGYLVNHCQKVRFHVWIIVVKQSYKKRSPRSQSHCFKKIKIKSKWSWIELPFWTWHMKASLSLRVFNFFSFCFRVGGCPYHLSIYLFHLSLSYSFLCPLFYRNTPCIRSVAPIYELLWWVYIQQQQHSLCIETEPLIISQSFYYLLLALQVF